MKADILEDPWNEPEEAMWRWSVSPEKAPDQPQIPGTDYSNGDIVAIDGEALSPAEVLTRLNQAGRRAWHWPAGFGGKSLCRHEIAGLL
jgi:argininosuccinate synthase